MQEIIGENSVSESSREPDIVYGLHFLSRLLSINQVDIIIHILILNTLTEAEIAETVVSTRTGLMAVHYAGIFLDYYDEQTFLKTFSSVTL